MKEDAGREVQGGSCRVGGARREVHTGWKVPGGRCMQGGRCQEGGACKVPGQRCRVEGAGRCRISDAVREVKSGRCRKVPDRRCREGGMEEGPERKMNGGRGVP
jgi:hypothetical protein